MDEDLAQETLSVGTSFASVPVWLLEAQASPNAVFAYAILAANTRGHSGPTWRGHKTNTASYGMSKDKLNRALRELRELRAITTIPWRREDGSITSSVHWIWFDPPFPGQARPVPPLELIKRKGYPSELHGCKCAPGVGARVHQPQCKYAPVSVHQYSDMNKNQGIRVIEEESLEGDLSSKLLSDVVGGDGKRLTATEKTGLSKSVTEWLEIGYSAEQISRAVSESNYKTPNAVGGKLRQLSQNSPRTPTPKAEVGCSDCDKGWVLDLQGTAHPCDCTSAKSLAS